MARARRALDDLADELRDHIERQTQANIERGLPVDEARRQARLALGSTALIREETRAVWARVWLEDLVQDIRVGLRALARTPVFALAAVLTLAIGIGANMAMVTLIRAVLLAPTPYRSEALVRVSEVAPLHTDAGVAVSGPTFGDWAEQHHVFASIAAATGGGMTLSGIGPTPSYIEARTVSASYFDVFELRPLLGRTFAADEDAPDTGHVVVISHRLWVSQFGANPAVLGTRVRLDGEPYTVIGVMPSGTAVEIFDPDAWVPRDLRRGGVFAASSPPSRGVRDLRWVAARLKPGVSLEQARREMHAMGERVARDYPETNKGWGVSVEPWPRPLGRSVSQSLYVLLGAVTVVLLIGCVNVAGLSFARSLVRVPEVATRTALGAGRARLVRQFVTEQLVVAVLGGAGGVLFGGILLHGLAAAIPSTGAFRAVASMPAVQVDTWAWLFAFGLSVLCGIISGLGPALSATGGALMSPMTRGSRGVTPDRRPLGALRRLVVVELAMACVLLTGALLLIQHVATLQRRVGVGFDADHVLTARLPMPPARFVQPDALNTYLDRLEERVSAVPGVRHVALAEGLPTQGAPFGAEFQMADEPPLPRASRPGVPFKTVSAAYFQALRLQMRTGRPLGERDRRGSPPVVVVNETFVRRYIRSGDPIGRRLWIAPYRAEDVWEIVGVVADEGLSWEGAPEAMVYATRQQHPSDYLALVVRGAVPPHQLQEPVRAAVTAVNRDQALTDVHSVDELKTQFMASDQVQSTLLASFAAVAIALASLGLYGALAYLVAQRQREIGIRAALGASATHLVMLIVQQGMVMAGWGVTLGVAGALLMTRLLSTLAFGGTPIEIRTIAAVVGIVAGVVAAACLVPARRAARLDALVALRSE